MTPHALAATYAAAFPDQRPWSANEFADLLDHPTSIVAGTPDSFCIGRVVVDEAEILTFATAPSHQRQGLGAATLQSFEHAAKHRGATIVHLEVAADNLAAAALYAKAGYTETSRRAAYYARPNRPAVDAVLMMKKLS